MITLRDWVPLLACPAVRQDHTGSNLLVCHTDVEGSRSVMPAKAGIQGELALACGYAAWIPGLALLGRNDVPAVYP